MPIWSQYTSCLLPQPIPSSSAVIQPVTSTSSSALVQPPLQSSSSALVRPVLPAPPQSQHKDSGISYQIKSEMLQGIGMGLRFSSQDPFNNPNLDGDGFEFLHRTPPPSQLELPQLSTVNRPSPSKSSPPRTVDPRQAFRATTSPLSSDHGKKSSSADSEDEMMVDKESSRPMKRKVEFVLPRPKPKLQKKKLRHRDRKGKGKEIIDDDADRDNLESEDATPPPPPNQLEEQLQSAFNNNSKMIHPSPATPSSATPPPATPPFPPSNQLQLLQQSTSRRNIEKQTEMDVDETIEGSESEDDKVTSLRETTMLEALNDLPKDVRARFLKLSRSDLTAGFTMMAAGSDDFAPRKRKDVKHNTSPQRKRTRGYTSSEHESDNIPEGFGPSPSHPIKSPPKVLVPNSDEDIEMDDE